MENTINNGSKQELVQMITEAVLAALQGAGINSIIAHPEISAPKDKWGSRQEACTLICCSLPTLHQMMRQGCVEYRKVGRRTLVNLSVLQNRLENGELAKYHRK